MSKAPETVPPIPGTPPITPDPEIVITPDWGTHIDKLTGDIEAVKKDRKELGVRMGTIDASLLSLNELAKKLKAPDDVKKKIGSFLPWDLYFGE